MTVLVRSDRSSGARIMLLGVENDLQGYGRVLIFFYNSADKQSFLTPIFIRLVTTTTNCFGHLRGVRLIIICVRYGNKIWCLTFFITTNFRQINSIQVTLFQTPNMTSASEPSSAAYSPVDSEVSKQASPVVAQLII